MMVRRSTDHDQARMKKPLKTTASEEKDTPIKAFDENNVTAPLVVPEPVGAADPVPSKMFVGEELPAQK